MPIADYLLLMSRFIKYITLSLTMVALVIMTFSKSVMLFNFYLNQQYITEQFCVNKSRPLMHCDGHCYLKKQMQREQQQEQALADAFSKYEVAVCRHYFPVLETARYQDNLFFIEFIVARKTSLYVRLADKRLKKPPIIS